MNARHRLLAASVVVALSACGDDVSMDAGQPDSAADAAAIEPCLRTTRLDMTPVDPRSCGVCVEPHVRVAMPYWYRGVRDIEVHAVAGGVLLSMAGPGSLLVFVTTEGVVVPLLDVPELARPEGYFVLASYIRPVPGRPEVWLVNNLAPIAPVPEGTDEDFGELFSFHYGVDGWTQIAADSAAMGVFPSAALPTGELVGLAAVGPSRYLGMIRARAEAGSIDRRIGVPDFGGAWPPSHIWPLESGDAAVISEKRVDSNGRDYPWATERWLSVIDSELEALRPPLPVTLSAVQRGYEVFPSLVQVQVNRRGGASLLFAGTLADMEAAQGAHLFVNRLTPSGELVFEPPGILANPDDFLLAEEAFDPSLVTVSPSIVLLGNGSDGVAWREYPGGDGRNHGQVIDVDGALMFEGGELVPSAAVRAGGGRVVLDGFDNAYVGTSPPDNTEEDAPVGYALVDAQMGVGPFILPQECPRLRRNGGAITGAHEEGAWVAWMDVVREPATGGEAGIVKVMLVRPDGSYAWGAD